MPGKGDSQVIKLENNDNRFEIRLEERVRLSGAEPVIAGRSLEGFDLDLSGNLLLYRTDSGSLSFTVTPEDKNIIIFSVEEYGLENEMIPFGFYAGELPDFIQGVSFWRYAPFKSWTVPIRVRDPQSLKADDIQFFYWQYRDGLYGAAIPLCAPSHRFTLGQHRQGFASLSENNNFRALINGPVLAIGFDHDPYALFQNLYHSGLMAMGQAENIAAKKKMPEIFNYLGWCSWNSSGLGHNLNEDHLIKAAESLRDHRIPLKWILVDDGWFQHSNKQLDALEPEPAKFPHGFKNLIKTLKSLYKVDYVGIWHTLNGYWLGINPNGPLASQYRGDLFYWPNINNPNAPESPFQTCAFIKPEKMHPFFDRWYQYFKNEGFSFVKVDNQRIVEEMSRDRYTAWTLADSLHKAVNHNAERYFDNAIINCMDMITDAFYHFGATPVGRAVEDYFPYEENESYCLQKGNAAAHVLQAIYNALWFGQMVIPDFDMFQSHHPDAVFHAIARALNCGPIYITDEPDKVNAEVLNPLFLSDGRLLKSETPLLPSRDCLFQLQDPKPFKAFSRVGRIGLLGIWNCADAESVCGSFSPADVYGIEGETFIAYERFSGESVKLGKNEKYPIDLDRLGYKCFIISPLQDGIALIGIVDKYNAPAAIRSFQISGKNLNVEIHEGGLFRFFSRKKPAHVWLDDKEQGFTCDQMLVSVQLPVRRGQICSVRVDF
jgi:raffinose synthase